MSGRTSGPEGHASHARARTPESGTPAPDSHKSHVQEEVKQQAEERVEVQHNLPNAGVDLIVGSGLQASFPGRRRRFPAAGVDSVPP